MRRFIFILVFWFLPVQFGLGQSDDADLWRAIKSGGYVVLMRHAIAPGIGDPEGFILDRCSTQRNLSTPGRQQAEETGEMFRQNGIRSLPVYSSQWCRCLDTASAMSLGDVEPLALLNSFYEQPQNRQQQTKDLGAWILRQNMTESILLVTHQVNINALTGQYASSGEMVVVKRDQEGDLMVIGSISHQPQ